MATRAMEEGTVDLPVPHPRERQARDLTGLPVLGLGLLALLGGLKLILDGKLGGGAGDQVLTNIGSLLIVLGKPG